MQINCFDKTCSVPCFEFDVDGNTEYIDYNPPIEDLDENIDVNEYAVELLINPILNGQSNVYALSVKKEDATKQTIGCVFPISALDSDQPIRKGLANYYYAGFYVLLSRLNELKEGDFSSNFEDNVCVAIINKRLASSNNPLPLCIHSLRKYCYSYFVEKNHVIPVKGYSKELFFETKNQQCIYVEMTIPKLYSHPMVDRIMRDLVNANNVTHRFVLLYQIIEFMMEDAIVQDVDSIYRKLMSHDINQSQYFEDINHISKERNRIKCIFDECSIATTTDFAKFRTSCKNLLNAAGFTDSAKKDNSDLFYEFRNSMTHSYRRLYMHENQMAEVIQYFERIVLLIVGNYPREIV